MTTSFYNKSVDEFSDRLFRFALKNMKDNDRARDVVQESFVRLWVKRNEVDQTKIRSWLFTTAYRIMVDEWRKESKMAEMESTELVIHANGEQYSDLKEILNEALEKLPAVQKSVLLLRDYEGYSYEEIGEITNLSASQVKVYIFRARVFLKQYLGSMEAIL